eukprot:1399880-Pleurochrysis_carterae.AAC.2
MRSAQERDSDPRRRVASATVAVILRQPHGLARRDLGSPRPKRKLQTHARASKAHLSHEYCSAKEPHGLARCDAGDDLSLPTPRSRKLSFFLTLTHPPHWRLCAHVDRALSAAALDARLLLKPPFPPLTDSWTSRFARRSLVFPTARSWAPRFARRLLVRLGGSLC